ncbi:hypothetical protein EMCRGX_G018016 [Ephydatia muelleri]
MWSLSSRIQVATACFIFILTNKYTEGSTTDPVASPLLTDLNLLDVLYRRMSINDTSLFKAHCALLRETRRNDCGEMNGTLENIRNVTCKFSQPIQNIQEPYADSCNKVIDVLCVLADINTAIISAKQSILDTNYGRNAHYLSETKNWLSSMFVIFS